ncbi:hypothetical protein BDP27DRAFT_1424754 [Rhodocollybia butyracea]|uniref:Uncharacterized protein n=1 Tax=Rhodocollybia butyracea TaxID=206335 RepID=A0A9P5U4D6_9AGAR|nr:hypothetical protein BDP27DRAFT_1424754 [Rhodocollybia butyracea]
MAVSGGPECFGLDLEKLEAKALEFPNALAVLSQHYFKGPEVFEVREGMEPLLCPGDGGPVVEADRIPGFFDDSVSAIISDARPSSRYVKGYIIDPDMVEIFLTENLKNDDKATRNDKIEAVIQDTLHYLRERSTTHQETYSISSVNRIGEIQRVFTAVSGGPECFGSDLGKLEAKVLEFPNTLAVLSQHYFRGRKYWRLGKAWNLFFVLVTVDLSLKRAGFQVSSMIHRGLRYSRWAFWDINYEH